MKALPILMSGAMVRAVLQEIAEPGSGKTQTRRLAWRSDGRPSPWQKVKPGDVLWVRETHYVQSAGYTDGRGRMIWYRASEPDAPTTWTPSMNMPRWASRITLAVEAVRVERLQEISEEDARAEGVCETDFYDGAERKVSAGAPWSVERLAFADLWQTLNGADAWERNPEIVAITFRPMLVNVDAYMREHAAA